MSTATDSATSTFPAGRTFTFPAGATVDLPAGLSLCESPETVTYDVSRYVTVGITPAGRRVLSSYSCAAYTRAAHVLTMREAVARVRARADDLERRRFTIKAGNLRAAADRDEAEHDAAIADWSADPAPCTCP
ncbi:hypothetical protein ACFVJK_46795 [Streptomyces sp. NPDC127172]|uniref:hypothetical protein n=1 Tax=Streptomyces sp. NPDC127172 TaxID=3345382 RepID=UPI00363A10AF